jgi:hypothetical protein
MIVVQEKDWCVYKLDTHLQTIFEDSHSGIHVGRE